MKKIILIIMTVILIMSCGGKKGLSEESKKRIQEEISKINDNMSDMELENMMTTAKINYDLNPEVGIMYFEKLVKYKPEAADLILEPKKKENPGYIFEFKVANSEEDLESYAEEGFEQIKEKKYDTELINRGVTEITYIGLAFYKKKLKMKYEKI